MNVFQLLYENPHYGEMDESLIRTDIHLVEYQPKHLRNRLTKVTNSHHLTIVFDYPLIHPIEIPVVSTNGFTLGKLSNISSRSIMTFSLMIALVFGDIN